MGFKHLSVVVVLVVCLSGCLGSVAPTGESGGSPSTAKMEERNFDSADLQRIDVTLIMEIAGENETVVRGTVFPPESQASVTVENDPAQTPSEPYDVELSEDLFPTLVENLDDSQMSNASSAVASSDYQEYINITLHFKNAQVIIETNAVGTLSHPVSVQVVDEENHRYYSEDEELLTAIKQLRDRLVDSMR